MMVVVTAPWVLIPSLQPTPLDGLASLRVNGMVDDVIQCLMRELDIPIPPFILIRHLTITFSKR